MSKPWWWGRKWWWPLNYWWMDQQPPFAICIDCDASGLTALKFASLLPGRVEGHPLTGAGTCVECFHHDRDGVNKMSESRTYDDMVEAQREKREALIEDEDRPSLLGVLTDGREADR